MTEVGTAYKYVNSGERNFKNYIKVIFKEYTLFLDNTHNIEIPNCYITLRQNGHLLSCWIMKYCFK